MTTVDKLNIAIGETIDKLCKESNYQITYAEINSALVKRLSSNLRYELDEEAT